MRPAYVRLYVYGAPHRSGADWPIGW